MDRPLPRRWPRGAAIAAAMALLLTQQPTVAFAEHGGRDVGSLLSCDRPVTPPRCTSVGDDLRHHVAFDVSLSADLGRALRGAMQDAYGRTRLTLIEGSEVTPLTDVIAFSGDYGDIGAAAWVYCPADAPQGLNRRGDRWCRHQELYFNLNPRFALFFDDDDSRAHVACHELGHTLGLRHWGNPPQSEGPTAATCMTANTPNGASDLHQIDVDHINAYPYARPPRGPSHHLVHLPDRAVASTGGAGNLVGASEVERYGSLAELVGASDLVVHGRVTAVEPGRIFGPAHHALQHAAATFTVSEQLGGRTPLAGARTVVVEVPLLDGPGSLDRVRAEMLGSERVLFLRNKATSAGEAGLPADVQHEERAFHRLVTFGSELVSRGGRANAPPDESAILDAFAGQAFDDVLDLLREAASRSVPPAPGPSSSSSSAVARQQAEMEVRFPDPATRGAEGRLQRR